MLEIGVIVDDRYKIIRVLGRGGTSCVYLAKNIRLNNYWAIKEVYKGGFIGRKGTSLIAEARTLTKLRHPRLPTIVDIIETERAYLIVMEYITGESLDKVLRQHGAQPVELVIKWGIQLCDVLQYLHTQQPAIIYRDMKPANIILKPDGNIALIDFGLAREFKYDNVSDTSNLGTRGYAAPEQYDPNMQTDARTDIYSLGVTLYYLVTGRDPCLPPYGISSVRTYDPTLPSQLDAIIQRCTEFNPEMRYQTAGELRNELNKIETDQMIAGNPDDEEKKKNYMWLWPLLLIPIILVVVAVILTSDNSANYDIYISTPDERKYVSFQPKESGEYRIYTESSSQQIPVLWISDEDGRLVDEDNTMGTYYEGSIYCNLEKGRTYYIETTLYDLYPSDLYPDIVATGSYTIYIERDTPEE